MFLGCQFFLLCRIHSLAPPIYCLFSTSIVVWSYMFILFSALRLSNFNLVLPCNFQFIFFLHSCTWIEGNLSIRSGSASLSLHHYTFFWVSFWIMVIGYTVQLLLLPIHYKRIVNYYYFCIEVTTKLCITILYITGNPTLLWYTRWSSTFVVKRYHFLIWFPRKLMLYYKEFYL